LSETSPLREIAPVVVIDHKGRFLLQLRDDIPGVYFPGWIGLFGGHREADESFLACAVRELNEELGCSLSANHFEPFFSLIGPDPAVPGGTLHAEYFIVRNLVVEELRVSEGTLVVVERDELAKIEQKLTPTVHAALTKYLKNQA